MSQILIDLARTRDTNSCASITAVCCAHPMIIRCALQHGRKNNLPVLIEATCNQVNHEGGYTGMQPQDFVDQVMCIAAEERFDTSQLILGGDHLGPNPWRLLKARDAMRQAEYMVEAYANAGFNKFHLDASMRCADDPDVLCERVIAERATQLATIIEKVWGGRGDRLGAPVYVIGTEVPPPGGANHSLDTIEPTQPLAALKTIKTHREVFQAKGLQDAFSRVVAMVVQPGVEFGDINVHQYQPAMASRLSIVLNSEPSFCFEVHSSDYQHSASLKKLASDGYRIQKVGPWLSFALREALYALDSIASCMDSDYSPNTLKNTMEALMLEHPEYWKDHYFGSEKELYLKRHFSYSDRIRYYWSSPVAVSAVQRLLDTLSGVDIPDTLVSQYLPASWRTAMNKSLNAEDLILDSIEKALNNYPAANGFAQDDG